MNWIAFVLVSIGNIFSGEDGTKRKIGFLLIAIGSICWMYVGYFINKDMALVLTNIVGAIIMARNWLKRRKVERSQIK